MADLKHFLVTGGAGFIGSHLVEALVSRGYRVTVLDDLSTGSMDNLASLVGDKNFSMIVDSVLNHEVTERAIRDCDEVFHLASAVGVKLIMEQPVRTIETIFLGTDMVLRIARQYGRKVLLTSTSEVYGKSTDIPFREDGDRLEGPTNKHRWAYACAKALEEFMALAHWKEARLPVICVRLFNTAGPRQTGQYGMVLPRFVDAALRGEPLVVYGDGTQSRCFCHVRDVIIALTTLMDSPEAIGNVFNVGTTEEISIGELARKVVSQLNSSSDVVFRPFEEVYDKDGFEDMQQRVPSLDKIENLIGWRPGILLEQIIGDVAQSISMPTSRRIA